MLARGMFLLHARYGKRPLETLISPAEQIARFGTPVSRALMRDFSLVTGPLLALAVKSGRDRWFTRGVSAMLAVSLLMTFYLTPQVVEIGRVLDFVSRDPPPPELGRFGALHAAYSVLDLLKLLLGIWLTIRLVRRPTES